MVFAIQLSDEQTRALAETARRLNVPLEDLAAAAIRDLLNRPSADFETIPALGSRGLAHQKPTQATQQVTRASRFFTLGRVKS